MRDAIVEAFALLGCADFIRPGAAAGHQHDFSRAGSCDDIQPARQFWGVGKTAAEFDDPHRHFRLRLCANSATATAGAQLDAHDAAPGTASISESKSR